MLQEERERNTESLVRRDGSWSPYPWTISDSLWKASWLSPPQTLAASMHTDLVVQHEQIGRERVKACTCVSLFVCCMCVWAGRLCDKGKGVAVLMSMSVYLLLQSQLSNLLIATL